MKRAALAWGPAVLWTLVLFFLSELRTTPPAVGPLLDIPDKVVHFALYLVLGGTLAWARHAGGARLPHLLFLVVGIAYGAVDEWHQGFVPGRDPSAGDWVADVLGVTAGYLIIGLFFAGAPRSPNANRTGGE